VLPAGFSVFQGPIPKNRFGKAAVWLIVLLFRSRPRWVGRKKKTISYEFALTARHRTARQQHGTAKHRMAPHEITAVRTELELELELTQAHMTQKPSLWVAVGAHAAR
jgi:hypothetical protein